MYKKRSLKNAVLKASRGYPVVLIIGPRQSGKTTFVKDLFGNFYYTNLEDPEQRLIATEDPKRFLSLADKMIIDEVQKKPDLLSYIQVLVDSDLKKRFVLTGSQNLLLLEKVSQSLAGRVGIFTLLPFDWEELKKGGWAKKDVFSQVFYGSYPALYKRKISPINWYADYITTYVERDVRDLLKVKDLNAFQRFLRLCAGRVGQILNLSSLATDLGVSVNTVKGWLSVLEASFLIFLLPPFYENIKKRIIKSPKLYFYDTGIVCRLLGIRSIEELKLHPLFGNIFENFCAAEIKKQNFHHNLNLDLFFIRDSSGREVDVVYKTTEATVGIEIKSSFTFSNRLISNLNYFESVFEKNFKKILIHAGEKEFNFKGVSVKNWMITTKKWILNGF